MNDPFLLLLLPLSSCGLSPLKRSPKMSKQKSLPSSHCCPVYPVTHWQLKEPHSPWQRPRRPQDGKPMLTQLLSVVRQPGELDWDSAGFPRSYSWGGMIESGHEASREASVIQSNIPSFQRKLFSALILYTAQRCDTWKCDARGNRKRIRTDRLAAQAAV